jgi:esterase
MQTVSLHFKEYGDKSGVPLIIIHGFLGSLDNWHTLATRWSEAGMYVIALDMRNHGKSPHTSTHSIPEMSADVQVFLHEKHIKNAVVLGHSMGGKVAMHLALHHPELVQKLVVVDIAPKKYRSGAHDDVFNAIKSVNLHTFTTRKEAEQAMFPFIGDFGTRQFVLKSLERDGDRFKWKFNIDVLMNAYNEVIDEIKPGNTYNGQVLFIKGGLSLYIKPDDETFIKHLFPLAMVHTIEQAGHWLHADKPDHTFELVSNFVFNT